MMIEHKSFLIIDQFKSREEKIKFALAVELSIMMRTSLISVNQNPYLTVMHI